jgi:hypothetical protein
MSESRRIDVAYTDGHWLAEVVPEIIGWFDCASLGELIEVVQREWGGGALLFVVDQSTVEGYVDAESQFREASQKSGALVICSLDI